MSQTLILFLDSQLLFFLYLDQDAIVFPLTHPNQLTIAWIMFKQVTQLRSLEKFTKSSWHTCRTQGKIHLEFANELLANNEFKT